MWSLIVVFLDPRFGLFPHLVQSLKHIHVEHCLAIAAIESFNEAVLHWFAWFDELECHAMFLGPFSQSDRHQFGTIVPAKVRLSCSADLAYGDSAQRTLNEGAAKHDSFRLYRKVPQSGSD